MNDGLLPALLLCATLGLALAFVPRMTALVGLLALAATTAATAFAPLHGDGHAIAFAGCWASLVACAAALHAPRVRLARCALALSVNAGAWAGAALAVTHASRELPVALSGALAVLPAAWLVGRRTAIVPKVVASWLVAVALLAATLQCLPVTPGYLPDHLE
jgi:hypothetical protein